jgi:hypothetical protein
MVGAVGVAGVIAQVVAGLGLDDYVFMPTALAIALVGMLLVIRSQGTPSPGSCLVAGPFNSVRRRVQAWVDRRFNRSRYDTERVMDGFAARLRDEVDSQRLVDGWVEVVDEAVQPSLAQMWLRT